MIGKSVWLFLLVAKFVSSDQELKLVHVLFVHPTEFAPPGQVPVSEIAENNCTTKTEIMETMTKKEKLITYELGVRLRQRYSAFLPQIYSSSVTRTRTTDADVSIMSGALVDAGLWPPAMAQQWLKDFNWQPVPTEYVRRSEDTLLMGRLCPNFLEATNLIRQSALVSSMEEEHRDLFSLVSEKTGLDMSNSGDIAKLYKSLKARAIRNLTLPSWTEGIYPDGEMLNVTYLEDHILSMSLIQRKLNGGFLIQKILTDSAAYVLELLTNDRKIMLYSGDSVLFVGVLEALGLWKPHVPSVASALIFEFWKANETDSYEMKIFYDFGEENKTIPLTIPGCETSAGLTGCRFDHLVDLLSDVLPGDDHQSTCGQSVTEFFIEKEEMTMNLTVQSHATRSSYGVFGISCVWILARMF